MMRIGPKPRTRRELEAEITEMRGRAVRPEHRLDEQNREQAELVERLRVAFARVVCLEEFRRIVENSSVVYKAEAERLLSLPWWAVARRWRWRTTVVRMAAALGGFVERSARAGKSNGIVVRDKENVG